MVSDTEHIIDMVRARLSEKRAAHTFRCASLARELAERFGANPQDAYITGLLHDIAKEEPCENQLKLCKNSGIILDGVILENSALLHAPAGAALAKDEFGASVEICRAILSHTVGNENMTTLDKCVWLADLIEPERDFPGVCDIRKAAEEDLDRAVVLGIDRTVLYLIEKGRIIHPIMLAARNSILREKKGL